jgi:hypothetical protein
MASLVLSFDQDGATQWMVGIDLQEMRVVLSEVGGVELEVLDLQDVLHERFNNVALLTTL